MGICYCLFNHRYGLSLLIVEVNRVQYESTEQMLIVELHDEDKVAAIVSNMTSKEAKKLMNQFFNKGKIDLRGYDANILDVDAYDSFINECPDEEDFCEADIEDADFELKNL